MGFECRRQRSPTLQSSDEVVTFAIDPRRACSATARGHGALTGGAPRVAGAGERPPHDTSPSTRHRGFVQPEANRPSSLSGPGMLAPSES